MWIVCLILCVIALGVLEWHRRLEIAVGDLLGVEESQEVPKLKQIRELADAGICFKTEELEHDFIFDFTNNQYYASRPYYALLAIAGSQGLLNRVSGISDRECVYGTDTYDRILRGLADISGLRIENIECPDRYHMNFSLEGKHHRWKARKRRDWVDVSLARYLNRFIRGEERFFTDNLHEGVIYYFGTAEGAREINRRFGLEFR